MEQQGWIKLYRCLLNKAIWSNSTKEQKVIFITLLLMANHDTNEWEWKGEKFNVKPGQFITSLDNIVKKCGKGITNQNVRTALNKFEKYGFLTNESTKTGRLITIVNWECYQDTNKSINKDTNKELTKNQQSTNKELTPNKNDKNDKNEKNIYSDFEKIILNKYPGKKVKATRDNKVPKLIDKYSIDELTRCIERYAKECIGKEKQFILNESTFWNGRYIDYLDSNYEESKAKPKEEFIDERSAKRIEARKKRLEKSGEPIGYNGG